ncbi:MAG: hypothetical protein K6F71_04450 [Ruminococcus sp.]|jgi:H+/Cl- antiporter ClcA|uniref:hypothetical protein n=1 Tax=Ruminococcus sp. TaxID=41978 RepID=UPI0025DC25BA|nr:hypothetical protein [Ruminococcus sp.]MCR5540072.1 hypothetical protein [Ruminococcus sp.]
MNKKKMSEWLYRALRTFGQAAIGYIGANIALTDTSDSQALRVLLTAAIAAGISALMNADLNHSN